MSGPPPEETPFVPIPITQHFLDAASAFTDMYGEFDIRDMSYLVSNEVCLRLLHELDIKDMSAFMNINYPVIGSLYGIKLEASEAYSDRQCALLSPDPAYHFEIPEPRKVKSPPKPDPAITPSYPCDFGAFDFVGQPIKHAYNWVNSFGFRTNWELILGLFTSVHPIYWLLYGFNAWLYMYNLVVLIVLISTMIYRSRYEQKPKRKANGEEMTSLSDLFEGYERIASETKPKRKGKYDLLEAILGDERGCISVSNMSDMYYVRIQSGVNPDGTTKWGKGIPMMSVGYYGNEIVGTPVYIGESPAGLGLSILGERHPGREQMATLGELFEGYEECPQAPEAQPTLVTKC